jgi:hypothetical protein
LIKVLLSIDRYFLFIIKNWKKHYFTQGIAILSGFILVLIIYLINLNVLFTYGYEFKNEINNETIVQCFTTPIIPSTYWMSIWSYIHSVLYSFLPFLLLIIINIFLIIDLKEKKKSITNLDLRNNKRKEISINLTIILMTILFILFTSPSAICSQFYGQLISSYNGTIILYVSDCIAFSYHALNIIILCLVNKSFLRRLKIVLGLAKEEEEEEEKERDNNQENNLNQDNNINRFSISHFF